LGSEPFVERMQALIDSKQPLQEIPKRQRRAPAKPLADYASRYGQRDRALAAAYRSGAYSMQAIAEHFGVGRTTVSRAGTNNEEHTSVMGDVNGKEVEHLGLYRVQSPLFTIGPLPENHVLENDFPEVKAGQTAGSVIDGYYLMLAPLSRGEHNLHFEGDVVFTSEEDGFDFSFELGIDYHITIIGGRR
jgi:hypothetical protein